MPPIQLTPAFGGQQAPFGAQPQAQGADPRLLLGLGGLAQGFLQGGQRGGLGAALLGGAAGALPGFARGQLIQQEQAQQQAAAQAAAQQQEIENRRAQAEAQRKAAADAERVRQFGITEGRLLTKGQRDAALELEKLGLRAQELAVSKQQLSPSVIRTVQALGIDPQSPEGLELVTATLTKPQVQIGSKPPAGFRFSDPSDPLSPLETIPGGPADRLTPEQSAKFQMMAQGAADIQSARNLIFNKDGSLNRKVLTQANVPVTGGAIPGTQGVLLRSLMWNAMNAQLRAESGAAVPPHEVDAAVARFMPSPLDTKETAASKVDRLEGLLGGALEASGRDVAPPVSIETTQQAGAGGVIPQAQAGAPAQPTTQADFDALPSGATFINPADGRTMVKN